LRGFHGAPRRELATTRRIGEFTAGSRRAAGRVGGTDQIRGGAAGHAGVMPAKGCPARTVSVRRRISFAAS
jgi:hypothetical protein